MKTIYAEAQPGKVVLKEKEIPAPGKGEVLLKAKYSAMSPGTENGLLGEHIVPLPTSIGYAMAAEVLEVGEGVEDLKVGDHVVATVEHAQYVVTSELNCTLCPEGVDLKQAAFWNLGHTGMYALRRSNLQLGEPCAVLGQGFVGAITAQCARIAGAVPVIVTDLDNNRLEAAKKMGADVVINSKEDPDGPIMQKGASLIGTYVNSKPYKLRRADLLIEGAWPPVMGKKLNRYVNSDCWTSDEDIQVFLNLIKYGKLDITPLISHEFSYKQIPEAYADYVFPHVNPDMTGGLICWEE